MPTPFPLGDFSRRLSQDRPASILLLVSLQVVQVGFNVCPGKNLPVE